MAVEYVPYNLNEHQIAELWDGYAGRAAPERDPLGAGAQLLMIPTYVGFALYLALSIGDLLSLSDPADVDDIVTSRGLPSALRAADLTEVMSVSHCQWTSRTPRRRT
jgi:hypothetical protein